MTFAKVRGTVEVPGSPSRFFQADLSASEVGLEEDLVASLAGDSKARVAVSMEMADKSFGTGFSSHVTVTISCNQDEETLRQVHAIGTALTEEFLQDSFAVAKNLAGSTLPQRD